MVKRVKNTKIGDVFEVKISDTEKKYMKLLLRVRRWLVLLIVVIITVFLVMPAI